jgi:ribonuclease T1
MKQASLQKRLLARLIILAVLGALAWFFWQRQQQQAPQVSGSNSPQTTREGKSQSTQKVPDYVLDVLSFIRKNGEAPEGIVGGREFQNREKRLPAKASDGKKIRYSEWDVHPKVKGQNRGPERLVTGSDHSAYYTRDHYKSFIKID